MFKLGFLSLLTVLGWCALRHQRLPAAQGHDDPYGPTNLSNSFAGTTTQPYAIALAMLDILRGYTGYENVNFVRNQAMKQLIGRIAEHCNLGSGRSAQTPW